MSDRITITITINLRRPLREIGAARLRRYIKDAVEDYQGCYNPEGPIFYSIKRVSTSGIKKDKGQ